MRTLILEDNRDRRVAMIGRLAERFPFLRVTFFDASAEMIDFMKTDDLQDVALISLDHDLELISGAQGNWIDPGTGLDVAQWLSEQPRPICPVVVHTTNSRAGDKMMRLLEKSRWASYRVIPHDDLDWIDTDWFQMARNAIVEFSPQHRSVPIPQLENKIGLLRSLLVGKYDSGRSFLQIAIARLSDVYLRDLRQMLEEVSVEVISFVDENGMASLLEAEGPIEHWFREAGIPLGAFSEWAAQGPLAPDQLDVDERAIEGLVQSGVQQLQIELANATGMQALLAVSAPRSLAAPMVQATIVELRQAIEIALFIGLGWPSTASSKLTPGTIRNRLP